MRPSPLGTAFSLLLLGGASYVAARPVGPLPALGPLLDPVRGLWSSAGAAQPATSGSATIPRLAADARVVYDDRGVPHVFASTVADAYRALGYVVARDRLFQIELQTRAGGGRLTELVGDAALPVDRETRASGMPRSAELRMAGLDSTRRAWRLMQAYVDGVNAYVDALTPDRYPLEYKLLGKAPSRLRMVDVLHLFNRMGATLASSRDELDHLEASALVGRAAADALFPPHAPIVDPIQPNGSSSARFDPVVLPPPGAPDSVAVALRDVFRRSPRYDAAHLLDFAPSRSEDAIGSNNWAVAPERTARGFALLAGDPHLELTLPSIWYEAHLVVGDSLDVYGVAIPGLPGIVIGFTQAVSWTFTNTGADVMDYYVETVDDVANPTRYQLDGAWRPVEVRSEQYHSPAGRLLATDTLRFTHRGPMRRVGDRWISARWTVLESTSDLEAFDVAARAATAGALLDTMAAHYTAPAQNMLAADTAGTIGIRSTGRFPIRPGDGRGDWLRDGSRSANDWTGAWPVSEYPQSIRPAQGFLASANQEPLDPTVQPRYFGANWERPWRAMQINGLLRADSAVTVDAMRRYQADPGSARADLFMPMFLQAVQATTAAGAGDAKAESGARLLRAWDRRYTVENRGAVLFEEAMRLLTRDVWDELRREDSSRAGASRTRTPLPTDMMLAVLLRDSTSVWWDQRATPEIETRERLLVRSLANALDSATARWGDPAGDGWRWSNVRHANIRHVLGISPFSRLEIPVPGGSGTLWPSTGDGRHGPSWRMVVEMSRPRQAWAIYPGGQSGDPLSPRYDDRLAKWTRGELDTLRLPRAAADLPASQRAAELLLTRGGPR